MKIMDWRPVSNWLPPGKTCALVFSIDDVHPATSHDAYEAGGDLQRGALGHVEWLLTRHPQLRVTLFVTPDWREIRPFPSRKLLAKVPILRDQFYLSPILPKGTMRLTRHPEFVRYLQALPRTEVGVHGLHHVHKGLRLAMEFQNESRQHCRRVLREAVSIFRQASLPACGIQPPSWNLSAELALAAKDVGLKWAASARDLQTSPAPGALAKGSGLRGVPLFDPCRLSDSGLIHLPVNFQASSSIDRAVSILSLGGVLSVKAHIVKRVFDYVAVDGMDEVYRNYLDLLFRTIHDRFGDGVWWTTMDEIARFSLDHSKTGERDARFTT